MSGIDSGLLPHIRRKIYGRSFPSTKRYHRRFDPGDEADVEDNKPPISTSPMRPDPTSVTFGGYVVKRIGEDDMVPQQLTKRKRHTGGNGMVNETHDTHVQQYRPERRHVQYKRRRNRAGDSIKVNPEDDAVAAVEDAVGYVADDEKDANDGEIPEQAILDVRSSERGRSRRRRRCRSKRGNRGKSRPQNECGRGHGDINDRHWNSSWVLDTMD